MAITAVARKHWQAVISSLAALLPVPPDKTNKLLQKLDGVNLLVIKKQAPSHTEATLL